MLLIICEATPLRRFAEAEGTCIDEDGAEEEADTKVLGEAASVFEDVHEDEVYVGFGEVWVVLNLVLQLKVVLCFFPVGKLDFIV